MKAGSKLVAKAAFRDAEKTRQFLLKGNLFDKSREIGRDSTHVYFPVLRKFRPSAGCQIVERELEGREERGDWKQMLIDGNILSPKESSLLVSAFDGMGDIAVMEMPSELALKEKQIAKAFLKTHTQFKVVAKKTSAVKGEFRVKGLRVIAGENRLATTYRENGCSFQIDLGRVYFSPRLSFERQRIARQVKRGEKVLALFAGAGFYPIIIAKTHRKCKIVAIELNPIAVKYMKDNVQLNKMGPQIEVLEGDVNAILKKPRFRRMASRAIMPLPHSAFEFLEATIRACKKNATIHFYYIPHEDGEDALAGAKEKIAIACRRLGRKCRIVSRRTVKTYAPHVDEVVLDFKLLN